MSDSLTSFFKKKKRVAWVYRSRLSLKKERCEWFEWIARKKRANRWKTFIFFTCFWQFFPFSCPPVFLCSFTLFYRVTWATCAHCSLQMSESERFPQVAHDKGAILSFFTSKSLFRSQKTSKSLEKLVSGFPSLALTLVPSRILTNELTHHLLLRLHLS